MVLKAHQELSPLENSLADFIFMNFVKVSQDLNPQRKYRTQVRMGRELELQEEPDGGSNAESGSSNPVTKSEPRQWKKGK